jgi:protein TonB
MAYAARQQGAQRYTTIGAVLLIHLALGLVVVTQFAPPIFRILAPPLPPTTFNVPPTTPPPSPQPTATAQARHDTTVMAPPIPTGLPTSNGPEVPIIGSFPPPTGPTSLTGLDTGNGGDLPALFKPKDPSPANSPSRWATTEDYPSVSLRRDEHGTTKFRVKVGSDGLVKACEIVKSSGHKRLDDATCRLVTDRARFEPARDEFGDRVAGSYINSVRWVLP